MLDEHKETTGDLTSQLEAAALLLEERTKELEKRNTELEASRGDNVIFHKELMTGKEKITELNAKVRGGVDKEEHRSDSGVSHKSNEH